MPRTTEQILAQMASVQAGIPELSALTSTSQVGFFASLKNYFSLLVQLLEADTEAATVALQTALTAQQVGSLAWYVQTIKAFQYGDAVSIYNGRAGYAVTDAAKQIVRQVSVTEDPTGRLLIKVAKANPSFDPRLAPLVDSELAALKEYVRAIKYAGVAADVVSLAPDVLKLYATVEYDRQVLNQGGFLLSNLARIPVIEKIWDYTASLPFDGTFSWTALSEYVKKNAPGVIDFQITQSLIKPSGASDFTPFARETVSRAGYMTLDPYTEFSYV